MGTNLANYYRQSIHLAKKTARHIKSEGVTMLAPSFYPTRLISTVNFLTDNGVNAILAGGGPGPDLVKDAPHFKLSFDTTGLDETEENIRLILSQIPKDRIPEKTGILLYNSVTEGDKLWQKNVEEMFGTQVVCSNEQNITSYFEEKTNLVDILKRAGLEKHLVPSTLIKKDMSTIELAMMYKNLKDSRGRIVIQSCGPNVSEIGGGHSTVIASTFKEFCNACELRQGYLKVATFIEGVNSNVSICAGNVLPNSNGFGALTGELKPEESRYESSTLDALLERGKQNGLTRENTISFVQPGTLKLVGEEHLTTCVTNGVGNQLNYAFPKETLESIYEIGTQLGSFMAQCGKVGLFGIDLIITKDGDIFINEINDRQQGPTETASLNNERHNLPGILRVGFLQSYANFADPEVKDFMLGIDKHSKEIYYESTQIESPYYIKLAGERVSKPSAITLSAGTYLIHSTKNGEYSWDFSQSHPEREGENVDLSKDEIALDIASVSLDAGEEITPNRQILRINGRGDKDSQPFSINEDGIPVLNEAWQPIIEGLKKEIYGENAPTQSNEEDALDTNEPNSSSEPTPPEQN